MLFVSIQNHIQNHKSKDVVYVVYFQISIDLYQMIGKQYLKALNLIFKDFEVKRNLQ